MNSKEKPLFTIITVTYNAAETITRTMESVAAQTCDNFEHLIIDGASKDGTVGIAKKLATRHCMITSERDRGLYDAMNKGIARADGQYLIFLNAGDTFHSADTLQRIADTIKNQNFPGVVYGQTQLVDADGNRVADRHLTAPQKLNYKSMADGMVVCHQAFVALAKLAPLYDLRYKYSADYDWCIQCLQHSRNNVLLPGIMIDYLQEGMTTANHKDSLIERFRIMCFYYGTVFTIIKHLSFLPRYIKRKFKHLKQ